MANYDSFVFCGHGISEKTGKFDSGATYGSATESNIVREILTNVKGYLDKTSLKIHYDENNFSDNDLKGNSYKYKCGISIHINAGGGQGCEIYVPSKEKYLESDFELVKDISTELGIPNRGVKSRNYNSGDVNIRQNGVALNYTDYYGEIREAWNLGLSLSLLECFFIDTSDLQKSFGKLDEIAYFITAWVCYNCEVDLPPFEVKPVPPTVSNKRYIVQTGSFKKRENAEKLCDRLEESGFSSFIKEVNE